MPRYIVEASIHVDGDNEEEAFATYLDWANLAMRDAHPNIIHIHAEACDMEEDDDDNWHMETPMSHDDPLPELTEEGEEVF